MFRKFENIKIRRYIFNRILWSKLKTNDMFIYFQTVPLCMLRVSRRVVCTTSSQHVQRARYQSGVIWTRPLVAGSSYSAAKMVAPPSTATGSSTSKASEMFLRNTGWAMTTSFSSRTKTITNSELTCGTSKETVCTPSIALSKSMVRGTSIGFIFIITPAVLKTVCTAIIAWCSVHMIRTMTLVMKLTVPVSGRGDGGTITAGLPFLTDPTIISRMCHGGAWHGTTGNGNSSLGLRWRFALQTELIFGSWSLSAFACSNCDVWPTD